MFTAIENALYPVVCDLNAYLSNYVLVFLLIAVGLWYSIRTRFVQLRCFGEGMRRVFGSLTLRVPSDMLDGVLSGAGEWGEVTREQTSAVDMTSTYTDNASRLESARAKKRQLDALYEKAETMEDIITLTDAIFNVQEEIEWLEGQNRRIDNQASMATLYVTINEKSSAVAAKQPLLTRMGEEFVEGMENFGEFVFGAVLGLIYALPWAAVAAVVIALARRWVRKKKKQ